MDIIMILGVMWLVGWLVIPMLYGIFITAPKQFMNGDFKKPKQEDLIENELDTEEDTGNTKEQMLKGFNPAFVEKNNHREFNNMDNNKKRVFNGRDYFYISTILILLVALYSLYTQYRNDSYTRVMDCFRDDVKEVEFCEAFLKQYSQ